MINLLLIPLFAGLDRFAGSNLLQTIKDKTHLSLGRPIYYAGLLAIIATAFIHFPIGALLGLAWMLWRLPAWKIGGKGGLAPVKATDVRFLFIRHLFILPTLLGLALMGSNILLALLGIFLWVLSSTLLGVMNGASSKKGKDINVAVEVIRGALFGLLLFCLLL